MRVQGIPEKGGKEEVVEIILARLRIIMDIEDPEEQEKEMRKFIKERLKELEREIPQEQDTLSLLINRAEGQFIHPETEIKRSWMVDGFKVNDPEIYITLLHNCRRFYNLWNKPNLRTVIGHSIIHALGEYFGNYIGTQTTESRNVKFYQDHTTLDSEPVNLSELKGKEIAVCAEKAAVAHNYLKFLGMNSHIIFSSKCILEGSTESAHAYIILATENGHFIFDPTNPILVEDSKGKINSISPAFYKISKGDYNHLLKRDDHKIRVNHINLIKDNSEYVPKDPQTRIYG